MPTTTIRKKTDNATAHLTESAGSPAEMVAAGHKHIPAVKASTALSSAAEVSATLALWELENNNLDVVNKKVTKAETDLAQARSDQASVARRWKGRAQSCVVAVTVFADGSKDVVTGFGMSLAQRRLQAVETTPVDLRSMRSRVSGTATARWRTHKGNHGYMVQHATTTTDATTHSAPMHASAGKFALPGQIPGATLYFRVAACDARLPGHQTAYTDWVPVTVSA
jgi:hypothetical protein